MNMWTVAAKIYGTASSAKNALYDYHFLDSYKLHVPVISVGNLTAGGSGKTPFVDWLMTEAEKRKIPAAVVSRNYRAESGLTQKVDPFRYRGAQVFGDEAFWLAQRHDEASVFVGPTKWRTAVQATANSNVRLVFVDDGFQHRSLCRDLDIVLLDTSVSPQEYQLLPAGFMREGFEALQRADIIVLTKVNFSKEATMQLLEAHLPKDKTIYRFDYLAHAAVPANLTRALAVSGIAKGNQFRTSIHKALSIPVGEFVEFQDHHEYKQSDIDYIHTRAKLFNCDFIVTTAKDQVKLANFQLRLPVIVLDQHLQCSEEPVKIYEFLDRLSHS